MVRLMEERDTIAICEKALNAINQNPKWLPVLPSGNNSSLQQSVGHQRQQDFYQ